MKEEQFLSIYLIAIWHLEHLLYEVKDEWDWLEKKSLNLRINWAYMYFVMGFPGGLDGKEYPCNVGDPSSIPGSGRSLGGGNGNPVQYSCLEFSIDEDAWWATIDGVTKSQTELCEGQVRWKKFSEKICMWKLKLKIPVSYPINYVWPPQNVSNN